MEEIINNKQIILKNFITGAPKETDMELKVGKIDGKVPQGSGAVLVKNLYLSCDPYMRGRMREYYGSYLPPFQPGSVIEGFGVAKIVDSDDVKFVVGDFVEGMIGWEEYSLIMNTDKLRKIEINDVPLSYHVGLLGMPGFTAYAGFYEVCAPQKGDYVFVSAASGAVGQLVGQLAKLYGCYVVGSAGTQQKIDLLKNRLGFDEAFNYREESDLNAALNRYFPTGIDIYFGNVGGARARTQKKAKHLISVPFFSELAYAIVPINNTLNLRYFPTGIDIYFDNVGGAMLDAALLNMRPHGRIAVCGMVSQHGISNTEGIHNLFCLVTKRVKMQGFLQSDYRHLFPQFLDCMVGYYKQGKIVYIEDVSEGIESAPASLAGLFAGKNVGKQVVCVSRA